jgi:26S proteasome regulatory subunit T1
MVKPNSNNKKISFLYKDIIAILNFLNVEKKKKIGFLRKELEDGFNLSDPSTWNLKIDKLSIEEENTLHVAQCSKILDSEKTFSNYIINLNHIGKFVTNLRPEVSPTDLEEGIRVCVDRGKYQIHLALPPKIDSQVKIMAIEEKPNITYDEIGGCEKQVLSIREIVEYPLLFPKRFSFLGIEPPKGVLLFGPPGSGKTLVARAVANRSNSCFIRVICSELLQKYIGEGARLVRELFTLSRQKISCLIFFDELDAIGGTRFDDGAGGDNEVQRTMLEIVNQLDGFEQRGNIKVLMATNRPDTIDPALLRPGRLDRKIEFLLPDLQGRTKILKIHSKKMARDLNLRFELLSRLCPDSTGADLKSICTEAGMFAIRKNHDLVLEEDFLEAINKVIKGYSRFNATPKYLKFK